jgi:hypothetical protein
MGDRLPVTETATPLWRGQVRGALAYFAVGIIAFAVLFSLRGYSVPGGDTHFVTEFITRGYVYNSRSPFITLLQQFVYKNFFGPYGFSSATAISFVSAVGGGIYVATLVAISRHWLFLLFNLASPLTLIFMGHVENYAWVNALLALYFLAAKRTIERGVSLWYAEVCWLLATGFHMLAVFYTPTFLYLLVERKGAGTGCQPVPLPAGAGTGCQPVPPPARRWRWRVSKRDGEDLLLTFIAWSIGILTLQMSLTVWGLDNGVQRLVPLIDRADDRFKYSMFSWPHLKMWLYFHMRSSPLGLAGLVLLARWVRGKFYTFMLLAVACGFFWTWIWHADFAERDWDLFANLGLPLNILVGLLLVDAYTSLLDRITGSTGLKKRRASV